MSEKGTAMTSPSSLPNPQFRDPCNPLRRPRVLRAACVLLAAACGSEDVTDVRGAAPALTPQAETLEQAAPGPSDTPEAPAPDAPAPPVYAVMYEVYDDVGSTSYLSVLDSLEVDAIDVSQAREYGGGRAFVQAYNNWLFVGDAQTPTVTRYSVAANGSLIEEGSIGFAAFGLTSGQFDSWNATFISPEKAYLFDTGLGNTIIWNPSTMQIVGEITPPDELFREGLSLETTPAALRDGLMFRTFSWVNYDDASYSTDFLLATYDVASNTLLSLESETRCPVPGNLVHTDEAGSIYFSNWIWPVAGSLMRGAPAPCVLRIRPEDTGFDPSWSLDYADLAEGRQGAMFAYLNAGRALFSAFYDERTRFDAETDAWSYVGSNNWRIWQADLPSNRAAPVEGIDFNGGAFTPLQLDGRLLVMVPGGEEDGYATQLYEISDGVATPRVKLPGWSYQFVKLR
jgi:hypothetical protein